MRCTFPVFSYRLPTSSYIGLHILLLSICPAIWVGRWMPCETLLCLFALRLSLSAVTSPLSYYTFRFTTHDLLSPFRLYPFRSQKSSIDNGPWQLHFLLIESLWCRFVFSMLRSHPDAYRLWSIFPRVLFRTLHIVCHALIFPYWVLF
jgi:hypothetical protein